MEIWNRKKPVGGSPIVDSALDVNSEHCVQNKVVAEAISTINSTLTKYKKFEGTTDGYGQLNFGEVAGEIVSMLVYGDRLFATRQSPVMARITNQTGAVMAGTQVTLIVGYVESFN